MNRPMEIKDAETAPVNATQATTIQDKKPRRETPSGFLPVGAGFADSFVCDPASFTGVTSASSEGSEAGVFGGVSSAINSYDLHSFSGRLSDAKVSVVPAES